MTETFYSPSRTLTFTSVIPSETSPLIPLSTQTTISGPESSGSGTLVSSGGTVPNTTPTPSPALVARVHRAVRVSPRRLPL